MATDIVLDDLTGDRITLTCSEVATGGDLTIDNERVEPDQPAAS